MKESLVEELKRHEGYRSHAYRDTMGFLTIGYGLNIDAGISEPLAAQILEWQVAECTAAIAGALPFWDKLSQARQEVFVNMGYNLGVDGLLGFRKMISAAAAGDIVGVCREMRDSKWYKQVGSRADELIEKYRIG